MRGFPRRPGATTHDVSKLNDDVVARRPEARRADPARRLASSPRRTRRRATSPTTPSQRRRGLSNPMRCRRDADLERISSHVPDSRPSDSPPIFPSPDPFSSGPPQNKESDRGKETAGGIGRGIFSDSAGESGPFPIPFVPAESPAPERRPEIQNVKKPPFPFPRNGGTQERARPAAETRPSPGDPKTQDPQLETLRARRRRRRRRRTPSNPARVNAPLRDAETHSICGTRRQATRLFSPVSQGSSPGSSRSLYPSRRRRRRRRRRGRKFGWISSQRRRRRLFSRTRAPARGRAEPSPALKRIEWILLDERRRDRCRRRDVFVDAVVAEYVGYR